MQGLENKEYQMQAIVMPDLLLADVVTNMVHRPQNAFEAEESLALPGRIKAFTASAIEQCSGGKKALLMRDFLPNNLMDIVNNSNSPGAIDDVDSNLARMRIALFNNLTLDGANPLAEDGILTADDFTKDAPRAVVNNLIWTSLMGSTRGSKINYTSVANIMRGPRPLHPYLNPEVVYSLEDPELNLHRRFGILRANPKDFHVTLAEYEPSKKTLTEALEASPNMDGLEKFMLDTINYMEGINFLHANKMAHRDVKGDNAFEGGVGIDNISVIRADQLSMDKQVYGTPAFMPTKYEVLWHKEPTPYFGDIFAFAISIAEAVSFIGSKGLNLIVDFHKKNARGSKNSFYPDQFAKYLHVVFFPDIQNKKIRKTWEVVEKMILGEGKYTLADATRDLSAIFGTRE